MNRGLALVLPILFAVATAATNAQTNGNDQRVSGEGGEGQSTRTDWYYIPATVQGNDTVAFELAGGAFKSYGCKPVDPAYWMTGNGCSVTIMFTRPEANPSFRVWGMNTDDTASVSVNGASYPLTMASASYKAKVVCGTSPGPDGVLFANGLLVGANTPSEANYSYQDIRLNAADVSSITITGLKGAGWGFTGISVYRAANAPIDVQRRDDPGTTRPRGR